MQQRKTAGGRGGPAAWGTLPRAIGPARVIAPESVQDWTPQSPDSAWDSVLSQGSLDIHFQPIISLKKKAIIGVEGLARPRDTVSGQPIMPLDLFAWASRRGQTVALDRLCRRKALASFSPMADAPQSPLLFLNFESSVLDQGVLGSGVLTRAVSESGLAPGQIVIEINESKVADVAALARFVEIHREQGFLFALDDLGAGFSNLDRIGLLKPEIMKLDRSLIVGIEKDFHKQELFKSLVGLGRRVGSLVLAEGVETEEEVSVCVDLGADMVQGFFFGRPAAADRLFLELVDSHLFAAAETQRKRAAERLGRGRAEKEARAELMAGMLAETAAARYAGFADTLARLASRSPRIECLYVLSSDGLQMTPTVFALTIAARPLSRLFQPATQGADHSSKEYFYGLAESGDLPYGTEPYLSLASGKLCRTLSCRFRDADGHSFILCVDMSVG
jgi:EAL domain-containing protein (putative c-di-GMP-specific phosphodiesterase class I)